MRAFEFHGDPGLVRLDPRWHQAALRFVVSGFWHILEGIDHLLFLLCLVIPFRRLRPLVVIVTAFTVAHSISLIAAAFGFVPDALWFPPLVETLIAATIVYMALENIVGSHRRAALDHRLRLRHRARLRLLLRPARVAAVRGRPPRHLARSPSISASRSASSLVLLVLVPGARAALPARRPERLGIIILSAFVAHTGWHWMIERGEQLMQFPFPTLDAAFLAERSCAG